MKSIIITAALLTISFGGICQKETVLSPVDPGFAPGGCYGPTTCGTTIGNFLPNLPSLRTFEAKMTFGMSSLNFASMSVSTIFMATKNSSNIPYIAGMSTGLIQTGYGIFKATQCDKRIYDTSYITTQEYDRNSARRPYVNIGVGVVTTLVNTFGLIRNERLKKQRDLSWNVFGSQENDGSVSMGINLVKRF